MSDTPHFEVGDIVLVAKRWSEKVYEARVEGVMPQEWFSPAFLDQNKIIVRPTFLRRFRRLRMVELRQVAIKTRRQVAELEKLVGV